MVKHIHEEVRVHRDAQGNIVRMSGTAQDLTGQAQVEEELRLFRNLLNKSDEAIFVNDPQSGRFIDVNDRACASLGYDRAELLGMSVPDIETTLPAHFKWEDHVAVVRRKGSLLLEGVHRRKDGVTFPVETNVSMVAQGGREYMIAFVRDIAERKRVQAAIIARERQLAESQRIAHIGSWEHNLTTGGVLWSDELFRLLGLDPKSAPADFTMFFAMVHPEDQALLRRATEEAARGRTPFSIDYRVILKNGETRVIHAQAELIADATGTQQILSGTAQDITERKRAEGRLRKSEQSLKKAEQIAKFGYWDWNIVTGELVWSDEVFRLYALDSARDEPSYEVVVQTVAPECRERFVRAVEDAVKNAEPFDGEYRMISLDGTVRHTHTIGEVLRDQEGRPLSMFGIVQDITERKLTEERLQKSEQFVRRILDTVDEGFIVVDRDYRILTVNEAYCRQVGLSSAEVTGKPCHLITHKSGLPCFEQGEECAVRTVFETGEPHTTTHKHRDPDGHLVYVETKAYPIRDSSGVVQSAIETLSNITERHLLETERLKTQKLESIGTLAGGIAHDFNNLLQGIFGYISLAKLMAGQPERSVAALDQAEEALRRSVSLTTQLLTFSRGGKPVKKRISLGPVIEGATRFALSGSRSKPVFDVARDLWAVEADEDQLAQVLQNIVLNGDQAMPLGGEIEIAAKNIPALSPGLPPGLGRQDHVLVSIRDSGVGIPEPYLAKIFDPYFTTKEKGTGLGLATSYSIIRNHGGLLDVQSEEGKGTTFFLYLAAVPSAVVVEAPAAAPPPDERPGRILVMDDEEIVRDVAGELLKALGHTAEFAACGEDAVARYQEAWAVGRPFDVAILDLTIRGGMGGEETLKRLLEVDPDTRAVVSSGYYDDVAIAEHRARGFKAFLKKPYKAAELQKILSSLLT